MTESILTIELCFLPLTFLVGLAIGAQLKERWWRWEMVERRHAMYHYYDGKWYWNEDIPKAKDPAANKVRELKA